MVSKKGFCPICKHDAIITEKWVKNKYGKKYFYTIYKHGENSHYVGKQITKPRRLKNSVKDIILTMYLRGQIPDKIIDIKNIRHKLTEDKIIASYETVRNSLLSLYKEGILDVYKINNNLYFINKVSELKDRFINKSIEITMRQIPGTKFLGKVELKQRIFNPTKFKLYYISFHILGDSPTKFNDLNFKSLINNEYEPIVYLVEDLETLKKLVLKLKKPIEPSAYADIEISYTWKLIEPAFIIYTLSGIDSIIFKIESIDKLIIQASIINTSVSEKIMIDNINGEEYNDNLFYRYHYKIDLAKYSGNYTFYIRWKFT